MNKIPTISLLCCLVFLLSGCGSISNIQPTNPQNRIDAKKYATILVRDFKNGVDDSGSKEPAVKEKIDAACLYFADLVADELRNSKAFAKVSRKQSDTDAALEIDGVITRYEPGNANLRLWIGLGAGSSYFAAQINFTDAQTKASLGQLTADKNSWALGGAIAASQTVEGYMQAAAKKVAAEVTGVSVK